MHSAMTWFFIKGIRIMIETARLEIHFYMVYSSLKKAENGKMFHSSTTNTIIRVMFKESSFFEVL